MDIVQELKSKILTNTVIPKPKAKADFIVKGWGIRRAEEALIYLIPNHNTAGRPYEKGINISEWRKVYNHISKGEEFDRDWFERSLPLCAKEGGCNFTTIGGIFQILGLVEYEPGVYKPHMDSFK